jgi:CRP-like cAMP-binding protein
MTMNIVEQLKEAPLFRGVPLADLEALMPLMQRQTFSAGSVLFEEGATSDSMYIILAGNVRIYTKDKQNNEITLSQFGPGRVFGDFALVDQRPRSASVAAIDAVDALILQRETFQAFLPKHPMVGLAMVRNLAERVRYATIYLDKINDFIQRLSLGEYEQAIQEISETGSSTDDEIQGLIVSFLQMVHSVQAREQNLAHKPDKPE